jgi:hypothetical protein
MDRAAAKHFGTSRLGLRRFDEIARRGEHPHLEDDLLQEARAGTL